MSKQFNWYVGEDENETEEWIETTPPQKPRKTADPFWFLVIAAVIVLFLIGGWQIGKIQLSQSEKKLKQKVQALLDLEHEAFLDGDGALFFSLQSDDPAWLAAQLTPENQAVNRTGLQATRAEQHGEYVWANVTWANGNETWQRITFFRWRDSQLIHVPNDPGYWGKRLRQRHNWGELAFYEIDETWARDIAAFVDEAVTEVCANDCPDGRQPFTLVLTNDYSRTAAPNQLHVPSPRLLALDEDGQPAPLFWQQLRQQIENHLTPAVIRFAVPPSRVRDGALMLNYERAAAAFMASHPDITVEIVLLDTFPDDLTALAAEFDGAALPPTEAMLAAGLVHDLTDFINSDPDFNQSDFYEQIWQGAIWRGRAWFMPQAAIMHVLFYDKAAYREADLPEPSLRWTWEEMSQDLAVLPATQPENSDLSWGFLDTTVDSIFSYAYNWNNNCNKMVAVRCQNRLQSQNIAAALDWYRQMSGRPGQMPDLTGRLPFDRQNALWNFQSSRRQAAIWVDLPVNYEHQLLLASLGVVPFPGSDRFDGITPLSVQGSFISQQSQRPLAMWQWLKFLSYQSPTPRLAPARPSVAMQTLYWSILPRPLGNAMRTAFPFARPVTIAEQTYLSWEQIAAVVSGELSPFEASQIQPGVAWFDQE